LFQGIVYLADNRVEAIVIENVPGYIGFDLGMQYIIRPRYLPVISCYAFITGKNYELVHKTLIVEIPVYFVSSFKTCQGCPVPVGIVKSKPVDESPTSNLVIKICHTGCIAGNKYIGHYSATPVNYIATGGNEFKGIVKLNAVGNIKFTMQKRWSRSLKYFPVPSSYGFCILLPVGV
jgi:hypothetical protein